jgi:pilus assembly protein CpaE
LIRVLNADGSASDREAIDRIIAGDAEVEIAAAAADAAAAIEAAQRTKPDIVLLDANLPGADTAKLTHDLAQAAPAAAVIVTSTQHDAGTMRQAMRAGAQDFLPKPLKAEELLASIHQVYASNTQRRALIVEAATAAPAEEKPVDGKIITMFSPKGGVGRTTIGVNLAIALRKLTRQRVAIADCNLQFGDVGIVMNCNTNRTIADLIPTVGDLSPQVLDSVLVNHESGVRVLLAPTRPEVAELFHPEHVKQILQALRRTHEYVVVDTWTTFQEVILGIFDVSSEIILLTTLDMPAIKNIRVFLDVCDAIQYPKERVLLVINRGDASSGLSLEDIEESVQHKVAATLVSAGALVTSSINRGVPFLMTDPGATISQNVEDLARRLLRPEDQQEAPAPEPVQAEPRRRQGLGRLMPGR